MKPEVIFLSVFLLVLGYILFQFYRLSKKASAVTFPDLESVRVLYRDKRGSGQSDKDWQAKMGSADKTLEIVLTEDELWIRGPKMFAFIAEKIDLFHRIPIGKISKVERKRKVIKICFSLDQGASRTLSIRTADPDEFIALLNKQRGHAN
ncbi:MAG: hypothetical protein R8P61_36540 [Bacteroidia bacterium]|nr:hypothetical protein [Bacteroidia bacterium]